jgi:hypothetical protein
MIVYHPVQGDQRTRKSWCIFPLKFLKTTYWFERVLIREEYVYYMNGVYIWGIINVTELDR